MKYVNEGVSIEKKQSNGRETRKRRLGPRKYKYYLNLEEVENYIETTILKTHHYML